MTNEQLAMSVDQYKQTIADQAEEIACLKTLIEERTIPLSRVPVGRWFMVWDTYTKSWCTGKACGGHVSWTRAPRRYDPEKCLLLPEHE